MRKSPRWLLVLGMFVPICSVGVADPEPEVPPHLVLKSGKVLTGKVVGTQSVEAKTMLRVETDFGEFWVPRATVKRQDPGTRVDRDVAFLVRGIRVVRVTGDVQRRSTSEAPWERVAFQDGYAKEAKPNAVNAYVAPGDMLRTGRDGVIDLMVHKDIWLRVTPDSEVSIPAVRTGATLQLLRGGLLNHVTGRPRGEVFRVQTPTTLLGVKGTFFACEVRARESVHVREGTVSTGTVDVHSGESAIRDEAGAWTVGPLHAREGASLDVDVIRFPADEMSLVPGGTYAIGGESPTQEGWPKQTPSDYSNSRRGDVTLPDFLIDRRVLARFEVAAWRRATNRWRAEADSTKPEARSASVVPANDLSWDEARGLALWMGRALPSEVQWEVAARGSDERIWPWGNEVKDAHRGLAGLVPDPALGVMEQAEMLLPASVWSPTVDVSPFGVRGLCSDPPEWTNGSLFDAPYYDESRMRLGPKPDASMKVLRGQMGSTRMRGTAAAWVLAGGLRTVLVP